MWFDDNAADAVNFYLSVFKDSKIHGELSQDPAHPPITISFEIEGQPFTALNAGPHYAFTPAISFVIHCEDQAEVDHYWDNLLEGGKAMQCGWLTDKFGVTWQVIPNVMMDLLMDPDPAKSGRVMQAMMQMIKLDIPTLQAAYNGD